MYITSSAPRFADRAKKGFSDVSDLVAELVSDLRVQCSFRSPCCLFQRAVLLGKVRTRVNQLILKDAFPASIWLVSKGTDGEDDRLQLHSCCHCGAQERVMHVPSSISFLTSGPAGSALFLALKDWGIPRRNWG